MPKAKITHSEYTIIISFPLQQWLRERASLLRYTYIVLPTSCSSGKYQYITKIKPC